MGTTGTINTRMGRGPHSATRLCFLTLFQFRNGVCIRWRVDTPLKSKAMCQYLVTPDYEPSKHVVASALGDLQKGGRLQRICVDQVHLQDVTWRQAPLCSEIYKRCWVILEGTISYGTSVSSLSKPSLWEYLQLGNRHTGCASEYPHKFVNIPKC